MIPSLLSTELLYEDRDFTWLAATPMIWLQISYNLSVVTSCIPTIKSVFDSLSGALTATVIDTPYLLTILPGESGFKATALDPNRTLAVSHNTSLSRAPKLSPEIQNQAASYMTAAKGELIRGRYMKEYRSESVENLTDGAVLVMEEAQAEPESLDRVSFLDRPHTNGV